MVHTRRIEFNSFWKLKYGCGRFCITIRIFSFSSNMFKKYLISWFRSNNQTLRQGDLNLILNHHIYPPLSKLCPLGSITRIINNKCYQNMQNTSFKWWCIVIDVEVVFGSSLWTPLMLPLLPNKPETLDEFSFNWALFNDDNDHPCERAVPEPSRAIKHPMSIGGTYFWTNEHQQSRITGQWASVALMIQEVMQAVQSIIVYTFMLLYIHC